MIQQDHATCSKCHRTKPLNGFVVDRSKKSGHSSQCKECRYPQSREWKTQNCERQNLAQRRYRKRVSLIHKVYKRSVHFRIEHWKEYDKRRTLRELRELGEGFTLIPEEETRTSRSKTPDTYSLKVLERIFDDLIVDGEVTQDDPLELFLIFVVLKLNAQGIWINFFILTS